MTSRTLTILTLTVGLAAGGTFLVVNLALVALAVRLDTGRAFLGTVVATAAPWAGVACLTSLLMRLALVPLLQAVGPSGIVLDLVCTGPLVTYFKAHRQRLESLAEANGWEPARATADVGPSILLRQTSALSPPCESAFSGLAPRVASHVLT